MTAEDQNFEMREGDSKVIETTDGVKDSDGSVKDVSGFDGQFTLAKYAGADSEVQYDQDDARFQITDGLNGVVECKLEPSDTVGLGGGGEEGTRYYYEIELSDPSGSDVTVTTGEITIMGSY